MAPKKKAGNKTSGSVAKPKAAAATAKESKEIQWVKTQLAKLETQKRSGPTWLEEPHNWHADQLEELLTKLSNGSVTALPDELLEGVRDYISQFDGEDVSEDMLYIDRDLYTEILSLPDEKPLESYTRLPTSEEASESVLALKGWENATAEGIDKLQRLLLKHEASAEVQETGIARLGVLLADLREGKISGSAADGLMPKVLTQIVMDAMRRFPQDSGVQRVGCSVLRGIIVMDGGVKIVADANAFALIVSTVKAHLSSMEVCKTGAGALYAVVQKTTAKSPERLALRATDALDILSEALTKHPFELKYACEVTLPELKG